MLRRNVNQPTSPDSQTGASTSPLRPNAPPNRFSSTRRRRETSRGLNAGVLVLVAVIITLVTYLFPSEVKNVEQEAEHVAKEAYKAEQEFMDWWTKGQKPPVPEAEHADFQEDGTARMIKQDSKWVDGEKKLKQKLKVLAERQAQGKDLGVPVLTRYLGEDIPAWPDETMDETTWRKKVDIKYAMMREEEKQWRKKVSEFMETQNHG